MAKKEMQKGERDSLAGQAGVVLGLLWLWHHLGDDLLLEWATRLGGGFDCRQASETGLGV